VARDNPLTMHLRTPLQANARRRQGFTLIEIMIAVVIVAILAAIALPSFLDAVRKSRRADAFTAISAIQQAQERWRGNRAAYADALLNTAVAPAVNGLGLAVQSASGFYDLSLSNVTASGYEAVATAVAGKSQGQDGTCKVLAVRVAGGNIGYGSGAAAADWTDPGRCWAR